MQEDEHKTNGGREPGVRRNLNCALKTVKSSEQKKENNRVLKPVHYRDYHRGTGQTLYPESLFFIYTGSKPNVQDVTSSQRRWNKWKIKEITMKCLA